MAESHLHDCSGAWFEMPLFLTHGSTSKTKLASILRSWSQNILTKLGQREGCCHLVAHQQPFCCPSAVNNCFCSDKEEFLGELQSLQPVCNQVFSFMTAKADHALPSSLAHGPPAQGPKAFLQSLLKGMDVILLPINSDNLFPGCQGGIK